MKAPDKIDVNISDIPEWKILVEYICKELLLKWLEQELAQRQQWLDRYGEEEDLHAVTELKKVIDKINSL